MGSIKLQSSDGEFFVVDVDVMKCSTTIKTMLENLGMEDGGQEVIPLTNINSTILRKVIEWATHHRDDPPILPNVDDQISMWDTNYFQVEQSVLFNIILAANYLDIKGISSFFFGFFE